MIEDVVDAAIDKALKRDYSIVHLVWEDAKGLTNSWTSEDNALIMGRRPVLVHTVGALLEQTKDYVLLSMSFGDGRTVDTVLRVPRGMVRSMKIWKTVKA